MTREEYDRLTPYEEYFKTAVNCNYVRTILNKDLEVLIEVGGRLGVILKSKHCGACILTFIKKLGGLYYEKREEISKRANRRSEKENSVAEDSSK